MNSRFLITSLPRSRTAWFAVATGALHEPISHQGWRAFSGAWGARTGVSDSGAAIHLPEIIEATDAPVLIIERPFAHVVASMQRYAWGRVDLDWGKLSAKLAEAEAALAYAHRNILRIAYGALDDVGVLRECFDHLGVPEPANLEQLMHMNIQSDLRWNLQQLAKRAA